jgi:MarR family 2-MHQ and catechol resistance regulon transcriptional repressor
MTVNLELNRLALRAWFLSHRTHELLRKCEDKVYGKYNLTTEQYTMLAIIEYLGGPVRITDIARWSGRSTNSISMIIDRMVKAGLVKRARDRKDRRAVFVTITSKAEHALEPATRAGLEFIQETLSPLSDEEKLTFVNLHEVVKHKALEYLNPGEDIEEMQRSEVTSQANLVERLVQYISPSTPKAKHRGGGKGKTI